MRFFARKRDDATVVGGVDIDDAQDFAFSHLPPSSPAPQRWRYDRTEKLTATRAEILRLFGRDAEGVKSVNDDHLPAAPPLSNPEARR